MSSILKRVILILAITQLIIQTNQINQIIDTSQAIFEPDTYTGNQQRVVEFFAYDEQDQLLYRKIQLEEKYVDYFIIFEALYHFNGSLKGLTFNKMNFQKYQAKIIYLPIINFPHIGPDLSQKEIEENQGYFFGTFGTFLDLVIAEHTTVILSQIDSIVKELDIIQFKKSEMNSQCVKSYQTINHSVEKVTEIKLLKLKKTIGKGIQTVVFNVLSQRNCQNISLNEVKSKKSSQSYALSQLSFPHKAKYLMNPKKRMVFQCNPYNGQDHIFSLKLQIQKQYIDYYILTESPYSHTGVYKGLTFNISKFAEYAHKIIYLPLLTLPYLYEGSDLQYKKRYANEYYMRDQASLLLRYFARSQDIILVGDLDQIVSKEGLQQFDPEKDNYAYTEMRIYFFYFNRLSVFDRQNKTLINYGYQSTRILAYKHLKSEFNLSLSKARSYKCNTDKRRLEIGLYNRVKCPHRIIRLSGWHFSYVLNDAGITKKLRATADSQTSKINKIDFNAARKSTVFPNAYTKDFNLIEAHLPLELINDVLKYKQKSKYAEFLTGIDYDSLNYDQKILQELRSKQHWTELNAFIQEQSNLADKKQQLSTYKFFGIIILINIFYILVLCFFGKISITVKGLRKKCPIMCLRQSRTILQTDLYVEGSELTQNKQKGDNV